MPKQQPASCSQIKMAVQSILNAPLLHQMQHKDIEIIVNLSMQQDQLKFLLHSIDKALRATQEVVIHLKILVLLHNLLIQPLSEENIDIISFSIDAHETRLKKRDLSMIGTKQMKDCLIINIELPYLIFLRKMVAWKMTEISPENTEHIQFGFCLINKIKEIISLKKIFHTYGCYFSSHAYAIDMFCTSIQNIKIVWKEVCQLVQDITMQALQTNKLLEEEYLFICAAEEVQDMLMEYIHHSYFSKKISPQYTIKNVVMLKHQIKDLEFVRKKSIFQQNIMKNLIEKKSSRKSLEKQSEKRTGPSENLDQKLGTEMQMEILDYILCLETLLGQ